MLIRNCPWPSVAVLLLAAAVPAMAVDTAATEANVNEMAAKFQKEQGLPGLVVASVAQTKTKGLLKWTGAYGQANIVNNEPMTTSTSLWLASLTKAVVGTIMTKAQEQGYLTYGTKASSILQQANSFVLGDPETMPWLQDITLEHIATHRSTIRDDTATYMCGYYVGDPLPGEHTLLLDLFGQENPCINNSPVMLDEFLRAYLSVDGAYYNATTNFLPSPIKPGEQTEYSNIATGLAGHLIALATNMSLPDYAHQNMFQILGMKDTSFQRSDLIQVATPYTKLDGALEEYMEMPIYDLATFPDGGLRSSVNDMALFLGTIMNDGTLWLVDEDQKETTATGRTGQEMGGKTMITLLEPESVQDMLRPRYNDNEDGGGGDSSHGIFWFITSLEVGGKQRNLIGHNGGDPGAFTYLFFDPDTSTGYFIAGNGEADALDPIALANLTAALFAHADELQAAAAARDENEHHDASTGSPADVDAGTIEEEEETATSKAFSSSPSSCAAFLIAGSTLLAAMLIAGL